MRDAKAHGYGILSWAACVVASMAALPTPTAGQDAERVRLVLTEVSARQRLEVTAPGLFLQDVIVQALGSDSVHLEDGGLIVPVAFDEIESVARRSGHGTSGAIFGGGLGFIAAGLFGALAYSFNCVDEASCSSSEKRGALVFGAAGALVGAGVGFWIGSSGFEWKPIFP